MKKFIRITINTIAIIIALFFLALACEGHLGAIGIELACASVLLLSEKCLNKKDK